MKKILLGLFLAVGFSNNLFANDNITKKKIEKVSTFSINCIIQTRIYYRDSAGNSLGYKDFCTEGIDNQCEGAVNGIVTKFQTVTLKGIVRDVNLN